MRKLLVTIIVLAVILVGLDFGGRALAESKLGETIAAQSGITPAPDVDIHGFSFLWQVVDGNYSHVTFHSPGLTVGALTDVDTTLEVYDISLPVKEAIGGNIDNLTAGRADLRAVIPPQSLSDALGSTDLTVSRGDGDTILLGTTLAVAGQTYDVQATVEPTVTEGVLTLRGGTLVAGGVEIPAAVSAQFLDALKVDLPLTGLPFDLQSGTVNYTDAGLTVIGEARDVPVGQLIAASQ